MPLEIPNSLARRVLLNLQGLAGKRDQKLTDAGLRKIIRQLGFVQIDSIRWVERAQHMILFSRNQHYSADHLGKLIEKKRWLFENYTHDASIIPCELFPYWRHRFERSRERLRRNYTKWQGDGFLQQCEPIIRRIRKDGPVRSRDLTDRSGKRDEMWQWSDGKTALEYLWRTGTLGVSARDGFEKVYDLIERTIPKDVLQTKCSDAEFVDWACQSAIERLGFCTAADIKGFWNCLSIPEVKRWLKDNPEKTVDVAVESCDGTWSSMLGRCDIKKIADQAVKLPNTLRVLSPFDPICRDRSRLQKIFNFDYRIEIYVPAAKRKYGYYVFPLLDGERFVGRIDMKAERNADCLQTNRIWWEDDVKVSQALQTRLRRELSHQARLANVSTARLAPLA